MNRLWMVIVAVVGLVALASSAAIVSARSRGTCETDQLHLTQHFLGAAAGQFTATFTFTNASGQVCSLAGWPAVALQSSSGRSVPVRTERVLQTPALDSVRPVQLAPHGSASFDLYGADYNAVADTPCPPTWMILVTPPGNKSAIRLTVRLPDCGRLLISPIITGKVDRVAWSIWASSVVLDADGIGSVRFGLPRARAISELRHRFGVPSAEGINTGCGPRYSEVAWGDLIAEFRMNKFSGYRYVTAGYHLPIPSGPRAPAAHGPTAGLFTANGITLGSSLADVRAAYKPLAFIGTDRWQAKNGVVFVDAALRDPEPPNSRIIEIKTGTCGDY